MSTQLRSVFGPSEIERLSAAYTSALSSITEFNSDFGLTARELRTQVAIGIIAAARHGQLDPKGLKDAGLQSLGTAFHTLPPSESPRASG